MARPRSLRERVIWAVTSAVALFVALLAVLAFAVLAQQEDELADSLVLLETQRLIERVDRGDMSMTPSRLLQLGPGLQGWLLATPDETLLPPALRGLADGPYELHPDDKVWHAVVASHAGGRVAVVFDATVNEDRVNAFGAALFGLWLLCTIAGFLVSRALARVVVGPMHDVTQRISSWAPGAPGILLDRDDEAGRLIEAFNRVQDRVDRSIAREREFAANLSHELRTPLTGLRTDAEMLALNPALTASQQERLQRMMRTVDDIVATMAATRSISSVTVSTPEDVSLSSCIDDACEGLQERAAAGGLRIVNRVDSGSYRLLDRYALLTVARNLIRNAADHAAPATLTIEEIPDGLRFADDGAGIAPADAPFVFERFYRGRLSDTPASTDGAPSRERGLGLAIAKRVCEIQGWDLSLHATPDQGATFVLRFHENSTTR